MIMKSLYVCKPTEINLNNRHDHQGEQFVLSINEEGMSLLRSLITSGGEVHIIGEKRCTWVFKDIIQVDPGNKTK